MNAETWEDFFTSLKSEAPKDRLCAVGELKDVSKAKGGTRIVYRASTAMRDRDGESIEPAGWKWHDGNLPNHLFAHNSKDPEAWLGKGVRVWKDKDALYYETELFDQSPSKTAEVARHIAFIAEKSPESLTSSVSFLPQKWVDPDGRAFSADNARGSSPYSQNGRKYLEQELLEHSVAPVPSLITSGAVGMRSFLKSFGMGDPEPLTKGAPKEPLVQLKELADSLGILLEIVEHDPEWARLGVKHVISRPFAKVGAVLSRANTDRLTQMKDLLAEVLASATPAEKS